MLVEKERLKNRIKLVSKEVQNKYDAIYKLLIHITSESDAETILEGIIDNYHERTQMILKGELSDIDYKYMIEQKNKIVKIDEKRNHKDYRSPICIAQTLVVNWLLEDVIKFYLEHIGCTILKSNATDADRLLVHHSTLNNDADLKIIKDGIVYEVEITSSFTNFVSRYNSIDLREVKLPNLIKKHNKGVKVSLLLIDFYEMNMRLININDKTKSVFKKGDKSMKGILAKDRYSVSLPKESIKQFKKIKEYKK